MNAPDQPDATLDRVQDYLQNRYGTTFKVLEHSPSRYWYGSDVWIAHPTSDPTILFGVYESSEPGQYVDTFPFEKAANKIADQLRADAERVFGPSVRLGVELRSPNWKSAQLGEPVPDLITRDHGLSIVVDLAVPSEAFADAEQLSAASLEMLQIISRLGAGEYGVSIGVVDDPAAFTEFVRTRTLHNIAWDNSPVPGVAGSLDFTTQRDGVLPVTLTPRFHVTGGQNR